MGLKNHPAFEEDVSPALPLEVSWTNLRHVLELREEAEVEGEGEAEGEAGGAAQGEAGGGTTEIQLR